jgi:hypothetical protein
VERIFFAAIAVAGGVIGAVGIVGVHSVQARTSPNPADSCNSSVVIAAAELIPPRIVHCDLVGRSVRSMYVTVRIPEPGSTSCGAIVEDGYRYRLCAGVANGYAYAVRRIIRVPPACSSVNYIPASDLRLPVLNTFCDLSGRLVRYNGVGVHVPPTGSTVCVDAARLGKPDIELCVTHTKAITFATASS